jgi:hypothetical protein
MKIQKTKKGTLIPLNQLLKEIVKWNTPLISCAAQIHKQYQKITCENTGLYIQALFYNPEYLRICHLSSPVGA